MLNLNNISFKYSRKELFRNINLSLEEGRIYGLLGRNGAGKTSLLRIMSGLLFPDNGYCNFNSFNVVNRSPEFLQSIFFIPEEFYLPPVKISRFISLRAPLYPGFNRDEFYKYLNEFDMDDDKVLNTLSFGQKKKFLLSFGLAANTNLLIMDEPTNGLDIPSKTVLRRLISASINDERIILVSTHQIKDVESVIDHILVVDKGEIIFNNSKELTSNSFFMGEVDELNGVEIYSQETVEGHQVIYKSNSCGNKVDLELLFNALIHNSDSVNSAISEEVLC